MQGFLLTEEEKARVKNGNSLIDGRYNKMQIIQQQTLPLVNDLYGWTECVHVIQTGCYNACHLSYDYRI